MDLNSKPLSGGDAFNLSALPMQKKTWGTCEVVYSHNFIRPNTVFEVGRGDGLVTTYTDKHPTYEFLNGPSGIGLSQGYFPEVSSVGSHSTAQEAWDDLHCKLPYDHPPGFHKLKHAGRDREDGGGGMVGWGYGSVEGVLRGTCRVSDEDIETIRERLAAETSLL